jgi:acyl-CoA hydrolase
MVNLKGKSIAERAQAIICLAHPDFREELERNACEHRLIPRGVSFSCRMSPPGGLHKAESLS